MATIGERVRRGQRRQGRNRRSKIIDLVNDMLRAVKASPDLIYREFTSVYTSVADKATVFTYRIVVPEDERRWMMVPRSRITEQEFAGRVGVMSVFVKKAELDVPIPNANPNIFRTRKKIFLAGDQVFQLLDNDDDDDLVTFYFKEGGVTRENVEEDVRRGNDNMDVNRLNQWKVALVNKQYLSAIPEDGNSVADFFFGKCENYSVETGKVVGRIPGMQYGLATTIYYGMVSAWHYSTITSFIQIFQTPLPLDLDGTDWKDNRNKWIPMCELEGGRLTSQTLIGRLLERGGKLVNKLGKATQQVVTRDSNICDITYQLHASTWLEAFRYLYKLVGWGDYLVIGLYSSLKGPWLYKAFVVFAENLYFFILKPTIGALLEYIGNLLSEYKIWYKSVKQSTPWIDMIDYTIMTALSTLFNTWFDFTLLGKDMSVWIDNFLDFLTVNVLNVGMLQSVARAIIWFKFYGFIGKNICPLMLFMTGQLDKCPLYLKRDLGKNQKKELLDNPKEELKF